jgi:hypothetical protein
MRPRTVEIAVSTIGRKRGVDGGLGDILSLRSLGFDLTDQNHGILGDHADQSENSKDGDEAERAPREQKRCDDTDQAERRHSQHEDR